ncbi:hypothetical protein AAMO2058_001401500 [Amorphochlora amoebiformis]
MDNLERQKSHDIEVKKKRKLLHRVLKNHPEFELTFDMQVGIRHVLGMEQGGIKDATRLSTPLLEDFEETLKLTFPREGSLSPPYTAPHSSRDFKFKAYAPKIFRRIRERFGISSVQFITSVCGNFEYLSFKTNSKSGQFFFYSHDKRYMLKTMTPTECKLLMKILPSYYQHVMENPNTLLCRFYGMHRVRPSGNFRGFHFLIMESVFNTPLEIHQIFDLKGSRVNRYAKRGESVYKDLDFIDNNFSFKLPSTVAKKLKAVVQHDAAFLKEQSLMDYSLLVGIHYRDGKQKKIEYNQDRIRRLKDKKEKKIDMKPIGVPNKYNVISQPKDKNVKMSQGQGPASNPELRAPDKANSVNHSAPALTHSEKKGGKPGPSKAAVPAHHGGLSSVDSNGRPGNMIFYVGIIDILTEYGLQKSFEHTFSSLFKDGNLISCVPAGVYGNRFQDFLVSRIEEVEVESSAVELIA